jgi:hypothetical protein
LLINLTKWASFQKVVWKDTKKLGVGFASTDDGHFYAVFYYFPAGNYKNEFEKNVLRPITQNYTSPTPSKSQAPLASASNEPSNFSKAENNPNINGHHQPSAPAIDSTPRNTSTSSFGPVQSKFIR